MPLSLKHTIFAGFGLAIVVLAALSLISYQSSSDTLESARWVAHTRQVLERLDALVADVGNAEAAYEEFVVSGNSRSLSALDSAFQQTPVLIREIRDLTGDNPEQQRRLQDLALLSGERLVWTQRLLDARRAGAAIGREPVAAPAHNPGATRDLLITGSCAASAARSSWKFILISSLVQEERPCAS